MSVGRLVPDGPTYAWLWWTVVVVGFGVGCWVGRWWRRRQLAWEREQQRRRERRRERARQLRRDAEDGFAADARNVAGDWRRVGGDLNAAVRKLTGQARREDQ